MRGIREIAGIFLAAASLTTIPLSTATLIGGLQGRLVDTAYAHSASLGLFAFACGTLPLLGLALLLRTSGRRFLS